MKYKPGDRIVTYQKGHAERGTVVEGWYDGVEYRYYVTLGLNRHLWSIGERWLKARLQKNERGGDNG